MTTRQEDFCEAMSFNVGAAEAARRAGYSANGAKQRGAFLMSQPEIRLRIDEIRAERRAQHQAHLDEADEQVGWVIEDAFQSKRPALALRAIEFRLKLRGVIQDKRIAQHYSGAHDTQPHPDADLENLPGDPDEDFDPIRFRPDYVAATAKLAAVKLAAAQDAQDDPDPGLMTFDDLPGVFTGAPAPAPAEVPAQAEAQTAAPKPSAKSKPDWRMTQDDLSREIEKIIADFTALLEPAGFQPIAASR
ncbi:terminase [Skermanella stibiiresistens SB22]|uniref:Terminase n=1 Tax=Skermanella stibiiresistens SB22 TaxID=1385369 RepID=W9H9Z7_9PROT|nr:terminase [Skermanella stibiiresistens SB22]